MRQHFDRARRLRRKILIDDEIQPSVLQILARMRRQIVTDNVNAPIGLCALERVHTAAHGLVCHINTAQTRVLPHLLQYAVVGQLVLLDTLDDVDVYVIIKNLVQTVKEAAHTQSVRREFTVAGNDEHILSLNVRCKQSGGNPAGFDHVLSDMIQAAALPHIRVAGNDRNADCDQPVDFLTHRYRVRRGDNETVNAALLHASDGLEIRTVRAVFQLLHQHIYII